MCKGHEKRDRLLVSKVEFKFQMSQRNKKLSIDPVFSNWVEFIVKVPTSLLLEIQRALRASIFFQISTFEFRKKIDALKQVVINLFRFFSKKKCFFLFTSVH